MQIPVVRWGENYESLEQVEIRHFLTGEPVASIGQANGGIVTRDLRHLRRARELLREIPCAELVGRVGKAADLFEKQSLMIGDSLQSPDEFVRHQSASTGLPEAMCRGNMQKNCFVLRNMGAILEALTRGLDLTILTNGYGTESRGVTVSFQAQADALGAVLPNNSPGVHTLWLPVIPLQMGLVLKPGSQEPWTAYRMQAAMIAAGIPAEAISLYPGGHDVGQAIMNGCQRSMIFGSAQTVEQYSGNPRVQVHGPGFSKVFFGDDLVDSWEDFLDVLVESVFSNGGRSCINCSAIYASRHGQAIAEALAERLGPVEPLPPEHPDSALAAFTAEGMGQGVWKMVEQDLREAGVIHCTGRFGPRLVEQARCSWLRPVICHADSPARAVASREFMFPMATVVDCPQAKMIAAAGPTLVGTAITADDNWIAELVSAVNIDRLNIGPIPTNRLNWLQPHEGNLIDFLFRSRAVQVHAARSAAVAPPAPAISRAERA